MNDKINSLGKRLRLALEKTWYSHNKYLFGFAIFLILLSIAFVTKGFFAMPSIQDQNLVDRINKLDANIAATLNASITNMTSIPRSETGETTFALPDLPGWSRSATLICTVGGNTMTQNNPLEINVTITINNMYFYDWYFVGAGFEIEPINAIEVFPVWTYPTGVTYEPTNIMPCMLVAHWNTSDVWTNTWAGHDTVVFQDAGPISLKISNFVYPTNETQTLAKANNMTLFQGEFNTTITIPNVSIESGQTIQQQTWQQQMLTQLTIQQLENEKSQYQQQIDSDWNFSLTYFILFFAAFDIAIAVLDYSKDDDRKAEYENRKANKELKSDSEPVGNAV